MVNVSPTLWQKFQFHLLWKKMIGVQKSDNYESFGSHLWFCMHGMDQNRLKWRSLFDWEWKHEDMECCHLHSLSFFLQLLFPEMHITVSLLQPVFRHLVRIIMVGMLMTWYGDEHLFILLGVIIVLLNQLRCQTSKGFAFLSSCVSPENWTALNVILVLCRYYLPQQSMFESCLFNPCVDSLFVLIQIVYVPLCRWKLSGD